MYLCTPEIMRTIASLHLLEKRNDKGSQLSFDQVWAHLILLVGKEDALRVWGKYRRLLQEAFAQAHDRCSREMADCVVWLIEPYPESGGEPLVAVRTTDDENRIPIEGWRRTHLVDVVHPGR